jgi:hypothetical protein
VKTKIFSALFALTVLSGCSKLTDENYQKISMGMTKNQVENLLGSPDKCSEATLGTYSCEWLSGEKQVKVNFISDKVAVYRKSGF